MTKEDLQRYKQWFDEFCKSFYAENSEDQQNILLKEIHTAKVCENMTEIAKTALDNECAVMLAEAIALFHDVGRFPQYARYKTFKDSRSVNHGLLGAETLDELGILTGLPDKEQRTISAAVKYHNAYAIPDKQSDDVIKFLRLVRDADKLDIWRVFIEYYAVPIEKRASVVAQEYPDEPNYSLNLCDMLLDGKMIPTNKVRTLNEYKLLQLSWIYDLNFKASFELVLKRDYINEMTRYLPKDDQIKQINQTLTAYVIRKAQA
ncbi:metal-dependent phosphohydrolase HD sub domain-containing protein [Candidatus Magnetoovum chiemensis]|nr:metal-dependent phosphohydrolase HD sub domain-containing protein [Candidatus Magnetoovum chiemensis]